MSWLTNGLQDWWSNQNLANFWNGYGGEIDQVDPFNGQAIPALTAQAANNSFPTFRSEWLFGQDGSGMPGIPLETNPLNPFQTGLPGFDQTGLPGLNQTGLPGFGNPQQQDADKTEPPKGSLKDINRTVEKFATEYSSAHGLPNIYLAGNIFSRIFWTLVFLTAIGGYLYTMQKLFITFLDFNVSTEVQIVTKTELQFPAVTVCNTNRIRRSSVLKSRHKQLSFIDDLTPLPYYVPCATEDIMCNNGHLCVRYYLECDGINHCQDFSDEWGCVYGSCGVGQFKCINGSESGYCIDNRLLCDRTNDCYDGEDEWDCECKGNEFKCDRQGGCIRKTEVCDGMADCVDMSDELNCPNGTACSDGFRCGRTSATDPGDPRGVCVPLTFICDDAKDCTDGTDEQTWACETLKPTAAPAECPEDMFDCGDGSCIIPEWTCDEYADCATSRDESTEVCGERQIRCQDEEYFCQNGWQCVHLEKRCNFYADCEEETNPSDDQNCTCRNVNENEEPIQSVICDGYVATTDNVNQDFNTGDGSAYTVCEHESYPDGQHWLWYQEFECSNQATCADTDTGFPETCTQTLSNCYVNSNGADYRGRVQETTSGKRCVGWNTDLSSNYGYTSDRFPLLGNHNFCRNPGGYRSAPWCFTVETGSAIDGVEAPAINTNTGTEGDYTGNGGDYTGNGGDYGGNELTASISLDENFDFALNDPGSPEFQQLASDFENTMNGVLFNEYGDAFDTTTVYSFSQGSVNTQFGATFNCNPHQSMGELCGSFQTTLENVRQIGNIAIIQGSTDIDFASCDAITVGICGGDTGGGAQCPPDDPNCNDYTGGGAECPPDDPYCNDYNGGGAECPPDDPYCNDYTGGGAECPPDDPYCNDNTGGGAECPPDDPYCNDYTGGGAECPPEEPNCNDNTGGGAECPPEEPNCNDYTGGGAECPPEEPNCNDYTGGGAECPPEEPNCNDYTGGGAECPPEEPNCNDYTGGGAECPPEEPNCNDYTGGGAECPPEEPNCNDYTGDGAECPPEEPNCNDNTGGGAECPPEEPNCNDQTQRKKRDTRKERSQRLKRQTEAGQGTQWEYCTVPTDTKATSCHKGISFEEVRLESNRLEILHYGEWGTVSDPNWDMNDANVVCQMLNLGTAVEALTNGQGANFGFADGPVWITNIDCNGDEVTLLDCVYTSAISYDHEQDVGVRCSAAGRKKRDTRTVKDLINGEQHRIKRQSTGVDEQQAALANDGSTDGIIEPEPVFDLDLFPEIAINVDKDNFEWICIESKVRIPLWQTCNNYPDCPDGSDEIFCGPPDELCDLHYRPCRLAAGCIDAEHECDGYPDCEHGLDEAFCSIEECPDNYWKCPTIPLHPRRQICIPLYSRCDTVNDCGLFGGFSADEVNCTNTQSADAPNPFEDPNWYLPYTTITGNDLIAKEFFSVFENDYYQPRTFHRVKGEDPVDWKSFFTFSSTADYSDLLQVMKISRDEIRRYGHQREDFILECTYDQLECYAGNFTVFETDTYGNCYTFNFDPSNHFHSTKTGATYGLRMTLNLQQDEYISLGGREAGVRVTITPPDVRPLPDEEGITIRPGVVTSIALRFEDIARLGGIYSACASSNYKMYIFEKGQVKLTDIESYDRQVCLRSCLHMNILKYCECSDTIQLAGPRCQITNTTQDTCTQLMAILHQSDLLDCDCPQQCSTKTFTKTTSTSKWPSNIYRNHLLRFIHSIRPETTGDINDRQTIDDNLVRLEVFYEQLNYASTVEVPAYEVESLISDVGGTAGLYIGFSLVTFLEFGVLLIEVLKRCCSKRRFRSRPQQPQQPRAGFFPQQFPGQLPGQFQQQFQGQFQW